MQICNTLLQGFSAWSTEVRLVSLCQLLGSILNKKAEALAVFINDSLPLFWERQIASGDVDLDTRRTGLRAWAWVRDFHDVLYF